MKIVLLDTLTFGETDLGGFNAFGEVEAFETTAPEETAERIANADVIVTNKVVITEEMMAAVPTLKLICVAATGTNNVDIPAAEARGIAVKNVAGYSTDSVIQHTFSMLFYLLGHSRYYDSYVKNGDWARSEVFTHVGRPFHEIKGKTWGIIGLGEIGRGVAAVAKAFGAEVRYYSTSGKNANGDYEKVTLSRLLEESDIVSIHAPLNAATRGLIGHSELLIMKDGATLLNLGRGGIVDERALAAIIDAKPLYVGLDVLETEPMSAGHPLMEIEYKERLYITPHIAWTSVEARDALIAKVIDNIRTFVDA
ncbi:D-2-hydroxyacid dehydrogenase [Sulfurimonas diazotrophicus]|uniref:D-2-hydroxyacid dehydrogenase n=1 Tax=Sulfurimonas diazotrophicus TaxID=3131939 RepID=A0ABZ3H9L5_9BACT